MPSSLTQLFLHSFCFLHLWRDAETLWFHVVVWCVRCLNVDVWLIFNESCCIFLLNIFLLLILILIWLSYLVFNINNGCVWGTEISCFIQYYSFKILFFFICSVVFHMFSLYINFSLSLVHKIFHSRVWVSHRGHDGGLCKSNCRILESSLCRKLFCFVDIVLLFLIALDPKDREGIIIDLKSLLLASIPLCAAKGAITMLFILVFCLLSFVWSKNAFIFDFRLKMKIFINIEFFKGIPISRAYMLKVSNFFDFGFGSKWFQCLFFWFFLMRGLSKCGDINLSYLSFRGQLLYMYNNNSPTVLATVLVRPATLCLLIKLLSWAWSFW